MTYLDRGEGMYEGENIPPISDDYFTSPSADFTALCRAQMLSLSKSLKMDWGGIYLTQRSSNRPTQLIPIIIYPQASREQSLWESLEPVVTDRTKYLKSAQEDLPSTLPQQMILPLLDQTEVIGLLVVVRSEETWLPEELTQLEATAEVISIARRSDQDCSELRLKVSQLQSQRQNQQQYLDDLLHQLRNPVTALRTFAKLLIRKLLPQDNNESTIKAILRESERLGELLKELPQATDELSIHSDRSSLFLLAETGKLTLESLSLKTILEPLINSAQLITQEKELELEIKIPQNLPQIRANAQALTEVLSNLIDNALKYTQAAGKILITAEEQGNWVKISISDSGYGIPPEEQIHVFERHYRGRQAQGDIPGSGLGLAIVKDLLEGMNGSIELLSPSGLLPESYWLGSTFIIWLLSAES